MMIISAIKLLTDKERHLITNIKENTVNSVKIKALIEAYGMGYEFMRFYADEKGDIVMSVQDNAATVYLKNPEKADEVAEFLMMISNEILSEYPLTLDGYKEEIGNIYYCDNILESNLDGISHEIKDGYNVLSQIFKDSMNEKNYARWYTDTSHRIRHHVSKLYTYRGICSGTSYCNVNGMMLLTQLGTLQEARRMGLARKLIHHIATDQKDVKTIALLSQDENSDQFYEKNEFSCVGRWYYYTK